MNILILSFYFPPDLSAGSFRMAALLEALKPRLPPGSTITIVTTRPNRYGSFEASAPALERLGTTTIHRIELPPHRSGMRDQMYAFASFAWRARLLLQREKPDVVVATTSRLMTGTLGAWAARQLRAPLYLDIRDIFVDTMSDLLSPSISHLVTPILNLLERWTVNTATKVNVVSAGFLPYFQARYPQKGFTVHSNGVDEAFVQPHAPQRSPATAGRPLRVLYAGNMGEGQGLHHIIPELVSALGTSVHFVLVGDGGRRAQLETALERSPPGAFTLMNPVPRARLQELYDDADVLFVHLNDVPAFRKVLPSKLFEYAATGKPIWAGLSGFPAEFVRAEIVNAQVFHPCDVKGALTALARLARTHADRSKFVARYRRTVIMNVMAADILALAGAQPDQAR